jgi:class 3 adenylate cyclase
VRAISDLERGVKRAPQWATVELLVKAFALAAAEIVAFRAAARAIRCAGAIAQTLRGRGVAVRAGVHTGECDITGDTLAGLPLEVTARIIRRAEAGEIVVSSTVRDLVAGSGLRFRACRASAAGESERRLFAVDQTTGF